MQKLDIQDGIHFTLSYREFRMDPVDVDRLVGAFFFES